MLTGRAVVLALTLVLLVFTLAVPARTLLAQRGEIAALQERTDATAAQLAELQDLHARLQDPAYVTSLIRNRLHYVLPGEVGYTVLDGRPDGAADTADRPSVDGAWYQRLWASVEAADGDPAVAPDGEPRVEIRPDAPR